MAINKREILQPILDGIESDWWIKKPSPRIPCDRDTECIFQNQKPQDYREAKVHISNALFGEGNHREIERLVTQAVKTAKPKF